MVARLATSALFVLAVLVPAAPGRSEEKERDFESAFLYDGGDGHIWLGLPVVHLGMAGVTAMPPVRLSPQVAERLGPLVARLAKIPESRDPWWFSLPRARGDDPLILVGLEARLAEARDDRARAATRPLSRYSSDGPELYEVTTARVRNVEFITREWRAAWDTANECLRQIVATSDTAPGKQKRRQIEEALEKAADALNLMRKAKIGDDWLAKARRVEPAATVIRSYQRRMGEEWQGVLESYAERLRISIRTPLPPRMPLLDRVKLLAASASPAEFVDTIKESWSEDLLEERLMYSSSLGRPVFMHEVPDMAPALFERLRAEARRQIAFRNEARRNTPTRQTSSTQPVEELHVVVRAASRDLLAEKLVLAGLVVEKVLDEAPAADLKPGDLIIGYDATRVAVMGPDDLERSAWWLVQKARHGGELKVLRGNQVLTITLPKSGSPSRR